MDDIQGTPDERVSFVAYAHKARQYVVKYWHMVAIGLAIALVGVIAIVSLGIGSDALSKAKGTQMLVVSSLNTYCLIKIERNGTIMLSGTLEIAKNGLKYEIVVVGVTVGALHIKGPLEMADDNAVPLALPLCGSPTGHACAQYNGKIEGTVNVIGTQNSPFETISQFEDILKINPSSFFVAVKSANHGGDVRAYSIYTPITKCQNF
jgi:hypothetical protein